MSYKIHNLHQGTWTEIQKPDESDLRYLKQNFPSFHLTNLEDSMQNVQRAKIDIYEDYVFISDLIPIKLSFGERTSNFEISIFLTKEHIVTITQEETSLFRQEQEEGDIMANQELADTPALLAYRFFELLYDSSRKTVNQINSLINLIDHGILTDKSPKIIKDISLLQRNIIFYITNTRASIPNFEELEHKSINFIDKDMKAYWGDLVDKLKSQLDILNDYDRLLTKLAKAHESYMMHHTNYVINILTVISSIFMPLTFIASLYGMNFEIIPGATLPNGFYLALIGMSFVAITMALLFKYKKWL